MAINEFKFAEAFTELTMRDGPFNRIYNKTLANLQRLQDTMDRVGVAARRMFLVGSGAGALFVKLAADAEETGSRFDAVFKDGADSAREFVDTLAAAVGRSKFQIQDSLASFQAFFVGMGFGQGEAVKLSKRMQTLAIDFASFNNLADAEASQRFISALSGSSEVLDMFGINIKASALNQELLQMGIKKSTAQATEQEKALARVNVIFRAMGQQGAVGDAVRTAGSATNQFKALKAAAGALAVELGQALLPEVQRVTAHLIEMVDGFGDLTDAQKESISQWVIFGGSMLAFLAVAPQVLSAIIAIRAAMLALAAIGGAKAGVGLFGAGAIGALIIALGVLASVWVTAKIRGESFGDTVNKLTADILGLENAVTKLDKAERENAARGAASRKAFGAEVGGADPITRLKLEQAALEEARKDEAAAIEALSAATSGREKAEAAAKVSRITGAPIRGPQPSDVPVIAAQSDLAAARNRIREQEQRIAALEASAAAQVEREAGRQTRVERGLGRAGRGFQGFLAPSLDERARERDAREDAFGRRQEAQADAEARGQRLEADQQLAAIDSRFAQRMQELMQGGGGGGATVGAAGLANRLQQQVSAGEEKIIRAVNEHKKATEKVEAAIKDLPAPNNQLGP